jgi:hypothetical protein
MRLMRGAVGFFVAAEAARQRKRELRAYRERFEPPYAHALDDALRVTSKRARRRRRGKRAR